MCPLFATIRQQLKCDCKLPVINCPCRTDQENTTDETPTSTIPPSHVTMETIATDVDESESPADVTHDNSSDSPGGIPYIDQNTPPPTYREATSEEGKSKYPKCESEDPPEYAEA